MKITSKDLKILATCETDADLTIAEISRRSGFAVHVVRRTLDGLEEMGVVSRRAYMNSFMLGTAPYVLALSLTPEGRRHRTKLHAFLSSRPEVSYIAVAGGRYNIFCEIRCASVYDVQTFLDLLSTKFGYIFSDKAILALTAMNDFASVFSSAERTNLREFATSITAAPIELDPLDGQILERLAKRWEESTLAIARAVGQPASTIDYRLNKLRATGILLGSRYFVDYFALGYQSFYHLVTTKGFHPSAREKLLAFARKDPHCHIFRSFVGSWDVMLDCHYESMTENIEFVERLVDAHASEISNVESVPIMALTKVSDCTVLKKPKQNARKGT